MAKSDYLGRKDADCAAQMLMFATNIGGYAGVLALTAAVMAAQQADANYFNYIVSCQQTMLGAGQQWTAWKDLIRGGGTPPAAGAPVVPAFPPAVPAVAPGIEARFRALVKQIKANPNYNIAMGDALGIEGAQQTGPDLTTIQPVITVELSGGQVLVGWGWGGNSAFLDMIELQVDRGDGKGFVFLANDTTPGYTDTTPLPATPTKWKYRGIYRVGDQRVGLWSNEVSITVGG